MPPLRIGFDMDGVLADFALAFQQVEERLFGPGPGVSAGQPEKEEEAEAADAADATSVVGVAGPRPRSASDDGRAGDETPRQLRRRRDMIWRDIRSTTNFWETLKPIEQGAVARTYELMLRHKWEVFFITQRPYTDGDTVQRQTQRWLVAQGFDLPSVLVLGGSRGAAAGALRLDYHIDDNPQNCIDVVAESRAKPVLIVPDADETTVASARKLGIGTARSISECLDLLDQVTLARAEPGLLARLAKLIGWR